MNGVPLEKSELEGLSGKTATESREDGGSGNRKDFCTGEIEGESVMY